jgi:hypothetical protein
VVDTRHNSVTANSAFQFDQWACFPVPTWHRVGHGAQRRGWEERRRAEHREHGEVATSAGFVYSPS